MHENPYTTKLSIATDTFHQLQRNKDKQKHYYGRGTKTLLIRECQGKQWIPATVIAKASTHDRILLERKMVRPTVE